MYSMNSLLMKFIHAKQVLLIVDEFYFSLKRRFWKIHGEGRMGSNGQLWWIMDIRG